MNTQEIFNLIKVELDLTEDKVNRNNTVVSNETGLFNPGPTTTDVTSQSNTPESVKAMYEMVNSLLYKYTMPLLNSKAVDVENSKKIVDLDSLHMEDIKSQVEEKYTELLVRSEKEISQSFINDLEIEQKKFDLVEQEYVTTKQEYEEQAQRVGRRKPILGSMSNIAYYILLVFIGICEVPLNLVIFQRFGESNTTTMIMAGTLAIAVPVFAHFLGMFWKHRSEVPEYRWFTIVGVLMFLTTNSLIGLFRANILSSVIAEATEHAATTQELIINIGIFVGITTILFVIGFLAAYSKHDFSRHLEHTYAEYNNIKAIYFTKKEEFRTYRNKFHQASELKILEVRSDYAEAITDILDIPNVSLDAHGMTLSAYEDILESARGMEKYIQNSYESVASSNGLDFVQLEKPFQTVKEFVIQ